jgi:hypothetical protein
MAIWEGLYLEGDRFFWGDFPDEIIVDWTDDYVFVPFGFTSAPKLRRLR